MPRKHFFLVIPYLGPFLFQTRTKLGKSLKVILNCYKLNIVSESQSKLAKAIRFKDHP